MFDHYSAQLQHCVMGFHGEMEKWPTRDFKLNNPPNHSVKH